MKFFKPRFLRKQNIVFLVAFAPAVMLSKVHANTEDLHNIIDICTSSERIMKDYALVGMKITYSNPQDDLKKTIKHLDEEMDALLKHKLTKNLHNEEVALQKAWQSIEHNLTHDPAKKEAMSLHNKVNEFARLCDTLSEDLAKDIGNPAEHYVVLIAELNQYVQQLAGDYIMNAWGAFANEPYLKETKETIKEYLDDYNKLMSADEKWVPKDIKDMLKVLRKHFMVFEVMAESISGTHVPLLVSKKANKIFKETKKILSKEEKEEEK